MLNLRYYNVKLLITVVILLFIGIDQLFHLISWILNEYWLFFKEKAHNIRFIKAPTNGTIIMAFLAWYDRKLWNKKLFKTISAKMYFKNEAPLKQTKSTSTLESIEKTEDENVYQLNFNHLNSGQREKGGLNRHEGVTMLLYNKTTKSFHGEYFNSPERGTHGNISIEYKSSKLQHKY